MLNVPEGRGFLVRLVKRTLFSLLAFSLCSVSCLRSRNHSVKGTQTSIQNTGSDTMVNLAQAWAEVYGTVDPSVSIEVSGGGTGTGIAALINGTVDIANCSRKLEPIEADEAIRNTGKMPKEFLVGYDALAIFVHKDNPLDSLTLKQLAEIYGEKGTITRWSDVGVTLGRGRKDDIVSVSRQSNSGTYFYFREAVLGKHRDYRLGTIDMNGSKDVVELVSRTLNAIGYSGMGYATDKVKMVRIASEKSGKAFMPSVENVHLGVYPIARPLLMYTLGEPAGSVKKYLDWISQDGQGIVAAAGYVPLALGHDRTHRVTGEKGL